jgi:hypothetical protein
MGGFFRPVVFVPLLFVALLATAARAEIADMRPDRLHAMASHIFNGKLAQIYSTVVRSVDWETTYSVAEIQLARSEKGVFAGQLAYVRFWRKRFKGKGTAPDGAYGHRQIPEVGSMVRVFVTKGEDGGYDVLNPNGFQVASSNAGGATKPPNEEVKEKPSDPG